jgi:hypothetical protein
MRNGEDRDSCLFGEELVAYIYGELNPADGPAFEEHLLDCSGCAAEFADISLSRLGVYEWHRDEFVPLATPHFEIPYHIPVSAHSSYSWIDVLGNFVSPLRLAFAGGSLAALVFGVILLNGWNSDDDDVATAIVPAVKVNENLPVDKLDYVELPSVVETKGDQAPATARDYKSARPARQFRALEAKTASMKKQQKVQWTSASSSPRLGTFVETEDKSLRLADLVADVDTRDFE